MVLSGGAAHAGRAPIDIEHFRPQVDGWGLFSAEGAETHRQWGFAAGAMLHYARNPLIVNRAGSKAGDLVDDRFTASFVFSLGLTRWLGIGAALPLALANDEDATLRGGSNVSGLGSARLHLKFRMLSEGAHGIGLAFLPMVSLPTGNHNVFLGQNGTVFSPMLILERSLGIARFLLNVGYSVREEARYESLVVDDELFWRVGLGLRVHESVELGGELTGATAGDSLFGSDVRRNPLELLAGLRILLADRWHVYAGGGPGLSQGYGSPTFRLFAGLYFSPRVRDTDGDGLPDEQDRCPTVPGPKANRGCPWPDTDGDGLTDNLDDCPTVPGPVGNRGCPWPDTDRDGVPDKDDDCPTVFGPALNRGCPWPDSDGDGIPDKDDRCPTKPGPRENQGCPWPDSDGDGIPDKDDVCPHVAGPPENRGCPWPDQDKDGIPDKDDDCPTQAGPVSNKGCPLKAVVVTKTEVRIRDQVYFRFNSARILPKSYRILNDVADTLRAYRNIRELEIQGHTDDVGGARFNLRLSQKRAEAVRRYLVRKGISASRLRAKGYGETKPLRPVDRARMTRAELQEARALNRRVQFVIVRQ